MSHWQDHKWVSWFYCINLDCLQVKSTTLFPWKMVLSTTFHHNNLFLQLSPISAVSSWPCPFTGEVTSGTEMLFLALWDLSCAGHGKHMLLSLYSSFSLQVAKFHEYFKCGPPFSKGSSTSCVLFSSVAFLKSRERKTFLETTGKYWHTGDFLMPLISGPLCLWDHPTRNGPPWAQLHNKEFLPLFDFHWFFITW